MQAQFAIAVRQSAAAWAAVDEPSEMVIEAARIPTGLSPAARSALQRRLASRVAPILERAHRAEDLAPARPICELEGRLGLPTSPACTSVERRRAALAAQEAQKTERCERAGRQFDECRFECTMKYDLFDPRQRACDRQCASAHSLPGCPKLDSGPD